MFLLVILWYCVDDYLARATGNPELGNVPLWVAIVVGLMLAGLHVTHYVKRN